MRLGIYILMFFCALTTARAASMAKSATDSLMKQLDNVIAMRPKYQQLKEQRLDSLHAELRRCGDSERCFDLLNELFGEYHPFISDSAYAITLRQEKLARDLGDSNKVMNALMNRANILSPTGMYHETLGIINSIELEDVPDYMRPYYFHIKRTVYGHLADYAAFDNEKRRYKTITDMYRDSLLSVNDPESMSYALIHADQLNEKGRPREAIEILENYIANNELDEHSRAICAWTLAVAYGMAGDSENQKKQLILSAISDMKSAVREYVSLRQLALLLYSEGDLDRAYRFLNIAVDDAVKYNARQRFLELNECYPQINAIYVDTVRRQHKNLVRTIIFITVLIVALLVLLLVMRKQMHRIATARRLEEEANRQLSELNSELQRSNLRLAEAYNEISDISELKETYISSYMNQCLFYIEKLDSYRKAIGKLANSGKSDDLKKLVKSSAMIDEELKAFYDQFDQTFLGLFPSFIEDFNALLQPSEQITPKRPDTLNPELRIYALIRLGITDSDKIAKFLRYSLTTIYNYRTKIRNKALGDRNSLEAEVMNISRRPKVG